MTPDEQISAHIKNILHRIKENNIVTKVKVKAPAKPKMSKADLPTAIQIILTAAANDIDIRKGGKSFNERLDIFTGRKFVVAPPDLYEKCVSLGLLHMGKLTPVGRALMTAESPDDKDPKPDPKA